jgi:hypothetical protein
LTHHRALRKQFFIARGTPQGIAAVQHLKFHAFSVVPLPETPPERLFFASGLFYGKYSRRRSVDQRWFTRQERRFTTMSNHG